MNIDHIEFLFSALILSLILPLLYIYTIANNILNSSYIQYIYNAPNFGLSCKVTLHSRPYWFLKQSILGDLLAMLHKIVCPPRSNPAYPVILVSTVRELLVMPSKTVRPPSSNPAYPAILVPEAINAERVISYAMQDRTRTR